MLASKDQSFNIQKVAILISEQRQRLAATVKSKTKLRLLTNKVVIRDLKCI